ncbi:MAG TPA: PAS domain S-box protein [Candidatus Sulfotelmatobacter sp.]|nr:PAS domain S-box protein [Candidatus Sulfotelmatobacter sp.]
MQNAKTPQAHIGSTVLRSVSMQSLGETATAENLTALLRSHEQELTAIYENVPGIVFYIAVEPGGEFRFVSVSQNLLTATGLSREQVVGSLVRDVIPPPSRDMVLNQYRKAIRSRQTVRWEEKSDYPTGQKWGEVAVTPLYDAGGRATHLIGIVHDITERKRLEEKRSHRALSALDAHIAVLDQNGNITYVNQAWSRFAERNDAPASSTGIGVNYFEICRARGATPEVEQILAGIQGVIDGSLPHFQAEYECPSPTEKLWFQLNANPLPEPERGVVLYHSDISNLRRMHDEHALVLESARGILWRATLPGFRTTFTSKHVERILGFPAEAWLNDESLWIDRIHPEDRDSVIAFTARATEEQRNHDFEYRMIAADGHIVWLHNIVSVIVEHGRATQVVGISIDITERKMAENSRLMLATIVDSADDAIVSGTVDGIIVSWNAAAQRMYGYTAEEAIGKPIAILLPSELLDEESKIHEMLKAGDRIEHFETVRVTKTGKRIDVSLTISPIKDSSGRTVGLSGIARDITERKRSEQFRFRHAAIVESSKDAIISKSLDGVITSWNTGAQKMFGYAEAEVLGKPVTILIPPELQDEEPRILQRLRSGERIEHYETVRLTKSGQKLDVSLTIGPIKDSTGEVLGYSKIAQDITDRKRVEHAVKESEQRFRLVGDSAPVLIWMSGTDKLCKYFNKPWLDFTGRSVEQELGDGWAEGVHNEDLERCLKTYSDAFGKRQQFEMEYRLRRHDGEYRWLLDVGVPRFSEDGNFAGYIGSCVDITERKKAEESLSTIGRKLIEAHEQERTWIARELHDDVNQQLALLAVELDQWRLEDRADANDSERFAHVQRRITEISKDVQALSHRLHSSKLEYLGLVTAAKSFCEELSEKAKVKIQFSHSGIRSVIPQEVSLCLFRVLQEALQNSVKYSGVRKFAVTLRGSPKQIELLVSDDGKGFDKEGALSQHGLGLISMRERVQMVNGVLDIVARPGSGTTICARVPLQAENRALAG